MAQCQKTAHAFVKDAFSPCVGIICSDDANAICQKNHLSFAELLLPFSRIASSVHIRDASGVAVTLQDFSMQFKDANTLPPQQTLGVRMLTEAVGSCCPVQREKVIEADGYEISTPASTPWFEEYRECFLSIIVPSDHEFLRSYAACVFVVSSSHADSMNQFAQMAIAQHQQQTTNVLTQTPAKLPKWFAVDLCRYYVLLHDCTDGEDSKAEAVYQSMKSKYGMHSCHLLRINSVVPNPEPSSPIGSLPDPWSNFIKPSTSHSSKEPPQSMMNGIHSQPNPESSPELKETKAHPLAPSSSPTSRERRTSGGVHRPRTRSMSERGCWLTTHDHERLKTFVQEFVMRALIPWAERLIKSYNELYQSKKRGGLFKNLFNRGKAVESKPVSGGYLPDSPEMQLRRLGDLCFMFQLYEQAYGVYHTLKKDFEADKTWMYCAGAQEMAGLCVFMQGGSAQRNYPTHYLDGAIDVYQTCKSQSYMSRAVFLSTEVLKVKGLWFQAASQFLKLTGEEFDLRSAVLLEQAAYCFLNMASPQVRKFAFYMVLAGDRYSKASQRRHSLRCYNIALQVYVGRNWTLAENHIEAKISRLSTQLHHSLQALSHASKVLADSSETVSQQSAFLKEYLQLYQTVKKEDERSLPEMAVPKVVDNDIMVTTDQFDMATNSTVYSDDVRWSELEENCVLKSQGSLPLILHRSIPTHNKHMKNTQSPRAIISETLFVRVMIRNPLKIPLILANIALDWRFQPAGEDDFTKNSKEHPDVVKQLSIGQLEMPAVTKQWVLFRMVPQALGSLNILSIKYSLSFKDATGISCPPVEGSIMLNVRGPRLNNTMQEKNSVLYGVDKRLLVDIQPTMPKIKVTFQSFPAQMQCGQVVKVPVVVSNTGPVELRRLHMTCSDPNMAVIPGYTNVEDTSANSRKVIALNTKVNTMKSNQTLSFDLWLRAGDLPTSKAVNFVFYYEQVPKTPDAKIRHRCSRYSFLVRTSSELRAQCNTHARNLQGSSELGSYLASIMLHNCSPVSNEAAIEFAVTDVICKSKLWTVSAPNADLLSNVRVNQSEVALISALLNRAESGDNCQLSQVHFNSEKVSMDESVLDGLLSIPFIKQEEDPAEEDVSHDPEVTVVLGLLWKGFKIDLNGATTETTGLICLPITTVTDQGETRTARTASVSNQYNAVLEIPRKSSMRTSSLDITDHSSSIEYQLLYQSHVTADLSHSRICVVPITVLFKSFASKEVTVNLTNKSDVEGLLWAGKTNSKVHIEPYQEVSVEVKVTVLRYGVYNLSSLLLTTADSVFIREQCSVPNLLIVDSK